MRGNYKRLFILLALLATFSMAKAQDAAMTVTQYINKFKDIAIQEMKLTGIPASITLAQGIIESANGSSYLARYAHNHFGMKCKTGWAGKTVKFNDDAPDECFRAYDKAEDSYTDHADYLKNTKRYAFLFQLPRTDYKGWANGLKQAGYASNPSYPQLLINTIESMGLAQYDSLPGDSLTANYGKYLVYNNISAYRTRQGETYKGIAANNKMMGWQIYRYNDLRSRYLDTYIPPQPIPGTILYLMPKKRTGSEPFHVMQPGESMYSISQEYGIKLKRLYKKNMIERGERMQVGDTVYLQIKRNDPPAVLNKAEIAQARSKDGKLTREADIASDRADNVSVKKDSIIVNGSKIKDDSLINSPYYIVQEGETLYGIAQKLNTTVTELKIENHLISDRVYKGQQLNRPVTILAKIKEQEKPVQPIPAPLPKKDSVKNETVVKQPDSFHIVQKGETLSGIAKKYHLTVKELKAFNNKTNESISIGERLNTTAVNPDAIYPVPIDSITPRVSYLNIHVLKSDSVKSGITSPPATFHIVQKGETLSGIAKKYHLTVTVLKTINNMSDDKLTAGEKLLLIKE